MPPGDDDPAGWSRTRDAWHRPEMATRGGEGGQRKPEVGGAAKKTTSPQMASRIRLAATVKAAPVVTCSTTPSPAQVKKKTRLFLFFGSSCCLLCWESPPCGRIRICAYTRVCVCVEFHCDSMFLFSTRACATPGKHVLGTGGPYKARPRAQITIERPLAPY